MELAPKQTLCGFVVESAEPLNEIGGMAYVMRHQASGAKLLYLANDDANKAFSISFKTPPRDDTGVFHILEHSVLCGSDKFPVKEPFVNLLKNSMQTFLNAMTFGDKTMYPVASTNEQDLLNLMDVYLDAVLHPAIYQKETIFWQEGWHLEVEQDATGAPALVFNGVVFNEMKGALSSPESVVYDELQKALFPDTAYAFESGGKPESIPGLTYEDFLDHHARHYRLDNSYIVLYGDMDAERFLSFLDERYLAPCATLRHESGTPNELGFQRPVRSFGNRVPMVTASENTYLALGYVTGSVRDHVRQMAVDILLDVLAGSNEAPLKRALLDADLAVDVDAYLADAMQQPFLIVQLQGLKAGATERFRSVVESTIASLVDGGLDHARVEASLSHAEFSMREANYGVSDGVALSMASLSGWLYDDSLATAYLHYEDEFATLRERLEEGYFEQVLREVFLENDHAASVELVPVDKLPDDRLAARLEALQAEADESTFTQVNAQVERLRAAQEEPDSPTALATLPHLGVADIDPAPAEPAYALREGAPIRCLRHEVPTRGIAYAFRYFDLDQLAFEELPYVTVLALMLGKLDTARHAAAELDTLLRANLGELLSVCEVHEDMERPETCTPRLMVGSSALAHKAAALATIVEEVLTQTSFTDLERIRAILAQRKVHMEQTFTDSGHSAAMNRVAAQYLPAAVLREQMGGVDFYLFLCDLLEHFDERGEELAQTLSELAGRIFCDERCLLSFAGPEEALEAFWEAHVPMEASVVPARQLVIPEPKPINEAFVIPSNVSYSAMGFDRRALGVEHSGVWSLAVRALSYDYLWNEVRVKGGAYGCGFQAVRSGNLRFYSFRDPRIDATIERFGQAGAWLAGFAPDQEEFEGYVVSTVAGIDNPVKPRGLVRRQGGWFLAGLSPDERLRAREEVIGATLEELRALGPAISKVAEAGHVCVFGGKDILAASNIDFVITELIGGQEADHA